MMETITVRVSADKNGRYKTVDLMERNAIEAFRKA